MRPPRLVPPTLCLLVALACSGRRAIPEAQPAPHPIAAAPVAPPTPPPSPRPSLALIYSADQRGRLTALGVPPPPGTPPRNPGLPPITTGGLARRATVVDQARLEAAAVVQVDAGDFLPRATDDPRDAVAPTPKDLPRWTALVLEGLHRLGVDAVTLGARELAEPGRDVRKLAAALDKAHVSVVLANLVDRKGAAVVPADKLIDAAGTSVGVFGVTELDGADAAALKKAGYALRDAAPVAHATAAALRARGAKLVVALVNACLERTPTILADAEVDLAVLGGHDCGNHGGDGAGGAPGGLAAALRTPETLLIPVDAFSRVERLDVRLAPGAPPAYQHKTTALETAVREQLGAGMLSRAATTPTFDSERILAIQSRKKHVAPGALRDLYEAWSYASTNACAYCHEKQVAQWKTTEHAHAFATLSKLKRDQDSTCLGCHTIGFLQPGGTRDLVMARTQFADVGCEACHGPSAEHVRQTDKHRGTSRKVAPTVCLGCHTPDWSEGFDPVSAMKEILGPGHGVP